MSTTTILDTESIILDENGVPLFTIELRHNGVSIIGLDGRRLAWVPARADATPASLTGRDGQTYGQDGTVRTAVTDGNH